MKFDLQVKSELNEPEIQKNFKLGNSKNNHWIFILEEILIDFTIVDMSKPVYRYMSQKQFEKAPKSKLMERLTQMNVIPDILAPGLNPTVEIAVNLPEGQIEPGVFIKPEQVSSRSWD